MLDNYEVAVDAAAKGIAAVPMLLGTKTPAIKWRRFQTELPSDELLQSWFLGTRNNIAVICTGRVVFDCDDPAKAERVLSECGDTPHKLKTPRGLHLGYRRRLGVVLQNRVKVRGLDIDIRTDGGLEIIPNSVTERGRYEWLGPGLLPNADLPVAKVGWTRERRRRTKPTIEVSAVEGMARRARAYLACVEGAISGQNGHKRTFRVACKLTHPPPRGFGLSLQEAWPLMKEWNEQCEPPWSDRELLHKLEDAIKKRT